MNPTDPSSTAAQEKAEASRATPQASEPSSSTRDATTEMPKSKAHQMTYLFQATLRIEPSLANLVKNYGSLERIIETKFHALDIKVTEIAMNLGKLKEDFEAWTNSDSDEQTTTQYQAQPWPAPATVVPPPMSTPPVPQTSSEAFAYAPISTASTHTEAALFITCIHGSRPG